MQKPPTRTPVLIKPPPGPPPKIDFASYKPGYGYRQDPDFRVESQNILHIDADDEYIGVGGGNNHLNIPLSIEHRQEKLDSHLITKMTKFMEEYSMPAWVKCDHCQSPNLFQNFECVKCGAPLPDPNYQPKRNPALQSIIRDAVGLT